ncbi:hypothetical protein [Rhizobium herbae]|uniref:Uncharacterized protein n=1 Tax=Rhizobium herbae TaxID=508661 RepID=A0ABS4EWI0_9HYPH|nr:hypothetical protein [Rhizobium herbae]MBP1862304.1 hypothetical protein [Rhizobium herbae]
MTLAIHGFPTNWLSYTLEKSALNLFGMISLRFPPQRQLLGARKVNLRRLQTANLGVQSPKKVGVLILGGGCVPQIDERAFPIKETK